MVLAGLLVEAAFVFIVVGLLCGALWGAMGWTNEGWIHVVQVGAFMGLNWLAFFEFRRGREHGAGWVVGGLIFLVPRGLSRIRYGRETYADDGVRGFEVLPAEKPPMDVR